MNPIIKAIQTQLQNHNIQTKTVNQLPEYLFIPNGPEPRAIILKDRHDNELARHYASINQHRDTIEINTTLQTHKLHINDPQLITQIINLIQPQTQ